MFDKELAKEIIKQIHHTAKVILNRFKSVKKLDDLINSPSGQEKLDAICMQLIVIGEGLKNFDKVTENNILRDIS